MIHAFSVRRLVQGAFLVATLACFAPHAKAADVGCGAETVGNAQVQYDQSQCGPVAPFPAAAGGTAESACGTLSAGTYHLTTNVSVGGDPTQTCFTLSSGPIVLDLAGFTITGRVVGSGINPGGSHIYSSAAGGSIICNDSSGTNPGCLVIANSGGSATNVLEIDHLTLTNQFNSTSGTPRTVYIDWAPSSNPHPPTTPILLVHNNASTAGQSPSSLRIYNFALQVHGAIEAYDNTVTCLTNSGACQGISAAGSGGPGATDVKIHNNFIEMQLLNPSTTGDTGRAALCDGSGDTTNVLGCEIYNNYIDVHDSRAIRWREVAATDDVVSAHDNLIDNATNGSTSIYDDVVHLCDPNSGTDDGTGYDIYRNTFNLTAGAVLIMERNCTGNPTFEANTINGTSWTGIAAWARTLSTGPSTLVIKSNAPINTSNSPQSTTETNSTLSFCDSGTVGGGGTTTAINCVAPEFWNFGSVAVGGSSSSETITVFNPTASAMTSLSLVVSGTNPGDFPVVTNSCGATLAAGTNCTASYKLSPTAIGSRSGTLTVTYAGGDGIGTQTASLSGTGTGVTPSAPGNPLITRRGVSPAARTSFRSSVIALLVSTLEVAP